MTKVGDDISDEHVTQREEIEVNLNGRIIKGAKTTRTSIDLRGEERQGKLLDFCEVIKPIDVVDLPDAVVIDPVVWEIPWETLTSISGEVIAVDSQGFLREQSHVNDDTILLKRWSDAGLLKRFKIYKSTEEELWDFTGDRARARLSNGNTFIVEGAFGRMFQVTPEGEVVWEYVNPYFSETELRVTNAVYRAYHYNANEIPGFAQ